MELGAFTIEQTHGILCRKEHRIEASSDHLGWSSLYVSSQNEHPYRDTYAPRDDHLIILHRDGPVRVRRELSGDRIDKVVPPGGLFILPAKRDFSVELGSPLSTIHIYVRSQLVAEAAAELVRGDPDCVELIPRLGERDDAIEQAAYAAADLLRRKCDSDWFADAVARMIAVRLVLLHSTAAISIPTVVNGLSAQRLNAVNDYIEANLEQPIKVENLAAAASLSPIHFSREFKKTTGKSPHQYLIMRRVERAKRLMRTSLSIAEIAYRCGFSHQEHLTRTFGQCVGASPAVYRRSMI